MSKALSVDLRVRVLQAVAAGASHREAADRFGVSAASVSRWRHREREQGAPHPLALGGDRRSKAMESQAETIMAIMAANRDITLAEIKTTLEEQGIAAASPVSGASSADTGSRSKKSAHASEQDRADVLKRREDWFDGQLDLDPDRLVFIDETWASTNMARKRGRCPKGERLRMGVPHGHWKTTTFVGALTLKGFIAPFVIDGPIDRDAFETYVGKVLVPELAKGDVVVMDNLSSHKGPRVREMIEAAGATLLYLPLYSPDFNPIEMAFSKLKALLRKAAERTIPALLDAIGRLIDLVTPTEAANYFAAAGYDPI
jgi:transposase